ncbi:MAG TPA: NAD(P)H-binding protein, partial [Solirubrobacterales bacterium]|nr:NAD(P)H-binding protein [Solirubrobacterales bacterium]
MSGDARSAGGAGASLLVAGATGYIGELLAERLLDRDRRVRCMARTPERAAGLERRGAEIVSADVLRPETLPPALAGVDVAYYLVHSMGRGGDGDFAERDKRAARNFGRAARESGVGRIVYLGGLGDADTSKHLRSRHETAKILRESGVPVIYFRAAAVLGAGSESFRTVYYLVKRLPFMLTPSWTENQTQPIAIADVLAYLEAAADLPGAGPETIEIGGPEVTSYAGMMDAAAEAIGVRPRP